MNLEDISFPTKIQDSQVGLSIALPQCNYEQGSPIAQTAPALSRESPRRASQEEDEAPGALWLPGLGAHGRMIFRLWERCGRAGTKDSLCRRHWVLGLAVNTATKNKDKC
jgi:hypothetical protein